MGSDQKLPATNLKGIKDIIWCYATLGQDVSNEQLSKQLGKSGNTLSRNNPFLHEIGLIEGGRTKTCTELCRAIGVAIEHNQENEIKNGLKEIVETNTFLKNIVSTVRKEGAIDQKSLVSKILSSAGVTKTRSQHKIGATCIIDLITESGIFTNSDGSISINDAAQEQQDQCENILKYDSNSELSKYKTLQTNPMPSIAINIQIELPKFDDMGKYDILFKSMRENLLSND